jgi:hypothetical protein
MLWRVLIQDLRTSKYRRNHGLEREEEEETDPTIEKPSTMVQQVDRTSRGGKARQTSSQIISSKEEWAKWKEADRGEDEKKKGGELPMAGEPRKTKKDSRGFERVLTRIFPTGGFAAIISMFLDQWLSLYMFFFF